MKKAFAFIAKWWKVAAIVVGSIIGVVVVKRLIAAITDRVEKPATWAPVPNNPGAILVKDGAKWVQHDLPNGIKSSQVKAAGLTEEGNAEVEIAHTVIDRSHPAGGGGGDFAIR